MNRKKILLCVTGGIAAYKSAIITSQLKKRGFDVKVMMTESAQKFITPLTFQTLSRNHVYLDTFDEKDPNGVAHIDLADCDLVVIAPATANVIGKLANGIADDMVTTTILATTAPVFIAPAMNVHMYRHPAVQKNLITIQSFGYSIIEPGEGLLACGYEGKGRLAEPEDIIGFIESYLTNKVYKPLINKNVLITAGPTREFVDPVRFFTNRSSGKMGYALAKVARKMGANVTLISGPTSLVPPPMVEVISIQSAEEMYDQVMKHYHNADIVIKSAAVADYKPKITYQAKMKKQVGDLTIEMERTKDILKDLGIRKRKQYLVGFAAESNNMEEYAKEKLLKKNLDMIVANNILQKQAGFEVDTNQVTILKKSGESIRLPLSSKEQIAESILLLVVEEIKGNDES